MKTSHGSNTPIYCSSSFKWKDNIGWVDESQLTKIGTQISAPNFKGIAIQSARTGKIKYFEPIYDEDGYDGEYMMYGCDNVSVQIWNY